MSLVGGGDMLQEHNIEAAKLAPDVTCARAGTPERPTTSEPLVRAIGTFGLAAAIVNITVGGGIFRLPAGVADALGPAAPLAYVVCAVAMGLIVLCIADAGSRVSLTGGPYAYIGVALGPYAAFLSGVLLWMLGVFATAAVATVFAASVGQLVPALAPLQTGVLVATFAFWSLVNLRGVALGARLNAIATVAKLLPLLLIAVGGLFFVPARASRRSRCGRPAGDVARTSLMLVFAFAGVEIGARPERRGARHRADRAARDRAGDGRHHRALHRAAGLGAGHPRRRAAAARRRRWPMRRASAFGGWARALLLAGAAISMFGYLGGMTLSVPRIVFALARDGYLPRVLGAVHPVIARRRRRSSLQTMLMLALAITGTFERLAILANVSALALYLGCAVAAWRLRRRRASGGAKRRALPLAGIAPFLAVPVIVWLLTGLTARRVDRLRRVRGRGVGRLSAGSRPQMNTRQARFSTSGSARFSEIQSGREHKRGLVLVRIEHVAGKVHFLEGEAREQAALDVAIGLV